MNVRRKAVLYRLCVEGLLHHWDQRRGIRSEFTLDEKLRVCREVALAMQTDDRAEYEVDKVREIVVKALKDAERAAKLMEHIRYRTGLLLERRPNVFAFAHLTFQEYLATCSIHKGNRLGLNANRLIDEHADGCWKEVIALYCGLAPASAACEAIQKLIEQPNTEQLSAVLAEAYLSASSEVQKNAELRKEVLERIALAPVSVGTLSRLPKDEVAPIANRFVGRKQDDGWLSESFVWLRENKEWIDEKLLAKRLQRWRKMNPLQIAELNYLLHRFASDEVLAMIVSETEMYSAAGSELHEGRYEAQAEIAAIGLESRQIGRRVIDEAFLQILRVLSKLATTSQGTTYSIFRFLYNNATQFPNDSSIWPEIASLVKQVAIRSKESDGRHRFMIDDRSATEVVNSWADALEQAIAERTKQKSGSKPRSTKTTK